TLTGVTPVGGVLLHRLTARGDVLAVTEYLDFGQGQRTAPARQLDTDVTAVDGLAVFLRGGQLLRQTGKERLHLGIKGGLLARIADQRHGVEQVAQTGHRLHRQRPYLLDVAIGGEEGHKAELPCDCQFGVRGQLLQFAAGLSQLIGGATAQQTNEIENDAFIRRGGRVFAVGLFVLVADSVEQHAQLALALSFRQAGQRLAAELVADSLTEQQFDVNRRRALHAQQVVGVDVLEEEAGAGRGREMDLLTGFDGLADDGIERLHRLAADEIDVLIGRLFGDEERHFDSLGNREEAGGANRLQAHARVRIDGEFLEQLQGVGYAFAPVAQHARRRGASAKVFEVKHLLKQIHLDDVVRLAQPQSL